MTQAGRRLRSASPALVVFVVIQIAAIPVLLHLGDHRWFQYDEWDFLASRRVLSVYDLFQPHSVHWSTLPVIVYRALWTVFGIRSYVPYQIVSICSHLVVALLVRTVMRRAGVRPWTATALATLLVFFGAGRENIVWAFQMSFTATIAFGLIDLLLADHDGPLERRDALALLAGVGALLCSGVAVTMIAVVGLAVLLRRGWRIALVHTVPLAVLWTVWYVVIGHEGFRGERARSLGATLSFARTVIATTYQGLARVPALGWLLAAVIVVGLVIEATQRSAAELRRAAAPIAMLAGAFAFVVITGTGRAGAAPGIDKATRFVYITATLTLPALAIAVDALLRRWRASLVVLGIWFVASMVGNVRDFRRDPKPFVAFLHAQRENLLLLPRLPVASAMPGELHPDLAFAPWVSFGWLRDGVAAGRIPRPDPVAPVVAATAEGRLVLRQQPFYRPIACTTRTAPADLTLARGSSLLLQAPFDVVYTNRAGVGSEPIRFVRRPLANTVLAYARADVHITGPGGAVAFELCDAGGRRTFPVQGGP